MSTRVGIDIGGTFTDFALIDEASGRLTIHKRLTTPADPAEAVIAGLPELLVEGAAALADVRAVVHGTTLITNALIERRGAPTGMLVTAGFADVLEIGRERRYDIYDLAIRYPEPLMPRRLRAEIAERTDRLGRPVTRPEKAEVLAAVEGLVADHGIRALAVCFLNSHAGPAHESEVTAWVREAFPGLAVTGSADLLPHIREYERWTTATMNATTQPLVGDYLRRLEDGLGGLGITCPITIMTASGGTVTVDVAARYPVRLLESGPAAGVLLAATLGRAAGAPMVLAYDMGGTTAKGALIRAGRPLKRYEMEVARVHEFKAGSGLPAKIPVLDLIEIGAGGGSIARLDARGVVAVGPRSAGADPGPAAYGRGGTDPTLTDANLALGYLDPRFFLGGVMALDGRAAEAALGARLAAPLGIATLRAAWGVHEAVNEDVARAFRAHASEQGFDYRRAAMIAFGGSGPMHAVRVAAKLGIPRVLLPAAAGALSAVGLLATPLAFEALRSERRALAGLQADEIERLFAALIAEASAPLLAAGLDCSEIGIERAVDARYRGQGHDLEVAVPEGASGVPLPALFADRYAEVFGRGFPGAPVEILTWKVVARGPDPLPGGYHLARSGAAAPRPKAPRPAYFPELGGVVEVPVYDRSALQAGDAFQGPALVEEVESTALIRPGDRVAVDPAGNLVVDLAPAAEQAA